MKLPLDKTRKMSIMELKLGVEKGRLLIPKV